MEENIIELRRKKRKVAQLSVFSNSVLVIGKLLVGIFSGSISIVSEAVHSAVDLLAAIIAFYAVSKSDKKPDSVHTFGHGKIENVSGSVEALLIVIAAIWIIWEAWHKFTAKVIPEFLELGIAIMAISMIVNIFVARQLKKVAEETESPALAADGAHLTADVWTSGGVLIGLVAMRVTGFIWLDPLIALIVAIFIFRAGYKLTRENVAELLDSSLPDSEAEKIRTVLAAHSEVRGYHRLRTRKSGSFRMIDMHVVMAHNLPLGDAHRICDMIETEIEQQLGLVDVIIHAEPCHDKAENCPMAGRSGEDHEVRSCNWCVKESINDKVN